MKNKKLYIVNETCEKFLGNLPYNELDILLNKVFSKQYFGNRNLYEMYNSREFNYHCQIGSFICCLNLLLPCNLIRGELLSNIKGKRFIHGWIETIYNGNEYVIDTSMGRAIQKKIYYNLLYPEVFQTVNRDDLFVNKYAIYLKTTLTKKNNLSLEKVYSLWWQYEDNWLMNIDDNTLLNNKTKTIILRKIKH